MSDLLKAYSDPKVLEIAEAFRAIMHTDGTMIETKENGPPELKGVQLRDLLTSADLIPLLPEAITHVILEEIEPAAIIYDNLFQQVRVIRNGTFVIHSIGPMVALPVGANGEYPQTSFAMDSTGYKININTQKYGLELDIADEVLEDNLIGVVGMWLRRAANALVRNREKMALDMIQKYGIIMFDNDSPSAPVKNFSGRDIAGDANGTMTMNDLMELYTSALMEGFTLDTMIMHPLAWQTFMTDAEMREIVLNNNTLVTYRPPRGSFSRALAQLAHSQGLGLTWGKGFGNATLDPSSTKLGKNPFATTLSVMGATFNTPPRQILPTPLQIIVSPYVPIRTVNNVTITDIIFAEAGETGLVLKKLDPITERFQNPEKERIKIRMKEVFGMGILNQGKGIRIAKNIVVDRNYVFDNVNSVTLSTLDRYADRV